MQRRPRSSGAPLAAALLVLAPSAPAQWTPGIALPTAGAPRLFATAVERDGALYVIGGSPFGTDGDDNAAVHILPAGGGAWDVGEFVEGPIVRQQAGVDALGRLVVFGGRDGLDPEGDLGRAYVYDMIEGQQNDIALRTAAAPADHLAAATDAAGRVYSIGGGPGAEAGPADPNSAHVERYDASFDAWTAVAPLPAPRADAAAVDDGSGGILVIGGIDAHGTTRLASVVRYDVAAGTWSTSAVPDLPVALSAARAVRGANDRIHVLGGLAGPVGAGTTQSTVWVLAPGATAWTAGPAMSVPRHSFAATLGADDHIHAIGGSNDTGGTDLVERLYTPPCPVIVEDPAAAQPWSGGLMTLTALVDGGTPMDVRWRRDGTDLADGPAPGGGTIAGSATTTLTISAVDPADDGVYDLVAMNACGATTSAGAPVAVRVPPALPSAWTVTDLHPAWAKSSSAAGVAGGTQGGTAIIDLPEYANMQRPVAWQGTAASVVDLTPAGSVGGAVIATADGAQVGWWWWPYTCVIGGQSYTCYTRQAASWSGTAASHDNLQVSGWEYSSASDTDGVVHVGTASSDDAVGNTFAHAGRWLPPNTFFSDLHPGAIVSKSFGTALDGDRQYGSINTPFPGPQTHAAMWRGTAASFVDLHPADAGRSWVTGAGDGQAVGQADIGGALGAALWTDSAASFVDLRPPGATGSDAVDSAGGVQAGRATIDGVGRAVLWTGTPASVHDLHASLPASFVSSRAAAIDVATDGTISVVGAGYDSVAGHEKALLWTAAPCPTDLDGSGGVGFADLNVLLAAWGPCVPTACAGDLDGNGSVGFTDLNLLLAAWGPCR